MYILNTQTHIARKHIARKQSRRSDRVPTEQHKSLTPSTTIERSTMIQPHSPARANTMIQHHDPTPQANCCNTTIQLITATIVSPAREIGGPSSRREQKNVASQRALAWPSFRQSSQGRLQQTATGGAHSASSQLGGSSPLRMQVCLKG